MERPSGATSRCFWKRIGAAKAAGFRAPSAHPTMELRIPTKPATNSNRKPATDSDLKPAGIPV